MTESTPIHPGDAAAALPAPSGESENLLRHYANVLLRRWRWVILGLAVGFVAGVVSTFVVTEAPVTTRYFKATNTLSESAAPGGDSGSGFNLSQAALQIQSSILLDKVGQAVDMSRDDVAASLTATVRPNVNAIDVTAIATQPEVAVRLANSGAETLLLLAQSGSGDPSGGERASLQQDLDAKTTQRDLLRAQTGGTPEAQLERTRQIQQLDDDIQSLTQQLQNLPAPTAGTGLQVLQPATAMEINARGYDYRRSQNANARSTLSSPNLVNSSAPDFNENDLSTSAGLSDSTRILLGSTAGLVLGLISAFVLEAWDDRVRRRDRVEEVTGLGVLTEIPHLSREKVRDHHVAVVDDSTGAAAERYRAARAAITFAMEEQNAAADEGAPVLMVTSPGPSEGKTTTVSNLAAAFADAGYRILVIDGDFRRPAVRRYLMPVPNLVSPDEPMASRIDGVRFLAGPHDAPTPEIANALLAKAVARWQRDFDLVILDTPPILTTNDAVDLLESADAVVLVLRADRTRSNAARRVAELLGQFRANTLGVVLNSCDRTEMNQYYGYGYGYGYGYLGKTPPKKSRRSASGDSAGSAGGAQGASVPSGDDPASIGDAASNGSVGPDEPGVDAASARTDENTPSRS